MLLLEGLLEIVAPTRCAGCDLHGVLLCERCVASLVRVSRESACPRCGAPDGRAHCEECRDAVFAFAAARCAGVLTHPLSRLIVLYKDGGERRLAAVLGGLLADAAAEWRDWAGVVVGVPASPGAVLRRGFDHGALLAQAVAAETGVPAAQPLRALGRGDQRRLGRAGRAANARAGFVVRDPSALASRVLLVDDVFTTGATLHAAATALLDAGAAEVRALAVARACEW